MDVLDLQEVARGLAARAAASSSGRAAQNLHVGAGQALRQTLVALTAGSSLSEHENPGEATLQVLRGHVRVVAPGGSTEGRTGELLAVPQERHSLDALEDATVLLTVVPR